MIVPATITPLTTLQARDALVRAWPGADRASAASLLALVWIETGRGKLVQHNAGMISAGRTWRGEAWRPPWFSPDQTDPRLKALHDRMNAGQAPSAFRAYPDFTTGFADFVSVAKAMGLLEAAKGSSAEFVAALRKRYSSDYTAAHQATFDALKREFAPLVAHLPPPSRATGASMGLGGFALLGLGWFLFGKKGTRVWR